MDDLVKQLMHATVSIDGDFDVGCNVRDAAVERLERADAATAAAYEAAAEVKVLSEDNVVLHELHPMLQYAIRALATPDQTAALDRLIADAVKPYVEALREIEMEYDPSDGGGNARSMYDIARTASKKGAP